MGLLMLLVNGKGERVAEAVADGPGVGVLVGVSVGVEVAVGGGKVGSARIRARMAAGGRGEMMGYARVFAIFAWVADCGGCQEYAAP